MPDQWATSTVKSFIRIWLTARDRVIMAGHELVEMFEDLVEEVRHERAVDAQRAASPPPPGRAARAAGATSQPRRTPASTGTSRAGGATGTVTFDRCPAYRRAGAGGCQGRGKGDRPKGAATPARYELAQAVNCTRRRARHRCYH